MVEYGYGEDTDFGMQLRNSGIDILYYPFSTMLHLKAPVGGFRVKPTFLWSKDVIQPKPSPTLMLFNLKYKTNEQLNGYKLLLFLKYYKVQHIKNPIRYFFNFKKQWEKSLYWALELKKNSNNEI